MQDIAEGVRATLARIAAAERRFGRPAGSVALVAVSKTRPVEDIRAALEAGQRRFGESYVGEAIAKIDALAGEPIEWHFVGPVQSNKTSAVARHFDWVHGIDRLKIARRLSEQRPDDREPLNACIQVNIGGEPGKSGVAPDRTAELLDAAADLPGLRVRGLMAIPPLTDDFEAQRAAFRTLRELREALADCGPTLDTLSMGMTGDLEAAIAEGATVVRIGTGIFGPRPQRGGPGQ